MIKGRDIVFILSDEIIKKNYNLIIIYGEFLCLLNYILLFGQLYLDGC